MTRTASPVLAPAAHGRSARRELPAAPGERFEALDAARGLAVLGMIGAHLPGTEGGATGYERALTGILGASEPTVAALFCVVAGVSWTIQAERAGVTPGFRRHLALRALTLGAFGVLFHVVLWPTEILLPFALMMLLSLAVLGRGPRVAAIAAVWLVVAAPIATALVGEHAVTDWADDGLHAADRTVGWATLRYLLLDGNYPLVSWMAFPLLGMAFWPSVSGSRAAARRWTLGGLGLLLLAHSVAALPRLDALAARGVAGHLAATWTPTSVTFLLGAGGSALAVVAALLWVQGTAPLPRALRPLALVGRASLTHYVLHIAVAYAALRLWFPGEDWPVAVGAAAMAAYLAIGIPLTVLWFRRHAQGPIETLWTRASRRLGSGIGSGAAEVGR